MTMSDRRRAATRSRAEEEFLAAQKKQNQELHEKEQARENKAKHVADLKAKRLAKEASENNSVAKVAVAKPKKKKKAAALPQFHRF